MNADVITGSLLSVPVLAFILGVIAARMKADLRLPDAVYQATAMYLLLAIGLKGGVALRDSNPTEVAGPILLSIVLGLTIPVAAFFVLRVMTKLGPIDRGAMAAHYGSTSLVTFTAALVFLDTLGVQYEGYVVTLLAIIEVPGILVGLLLAGRAAGGARTSEVLREVVTGRSVLLLAGGLVIGLLAGPVGFERVSPFFVTLFAGVLTMFLLEMGVLTGRRLGDMRTAGLGVVLFAVLFPITAGAIGVASALAIGMSPGGSMILGVLCASASYIAAPAAVRLALPAANPGITLTTSLGITFPFNLIIGIPLYWWMAQELAGVFA